MTNLLSFAKYATFGRALLAALTLASVCPRAQAEGPMAVYNRRVMGMLRDNCKTTSLMSALARPDAGLHSGWAWKNGALDASKGDWVLVEVPRNQATTYKWQTLSTDTNSLSIRLVLPRDLSACAIVQQADGTERLEVVTTSVLLQGDARRLWNQARSWAPTDRTCGKVYPSFVVVDEDVATAVPGCRPAHAQWTREALAWIVRSELR